MSGLVNFEIDRGNNDLENLNLFVLDMLGRTVHQAPINQNDFTLNLLNLPSGTYYFEIYEADLKLGTGKLILTKL